MHHKQMIDIARKAARHKFVISYIGADFEMLKQVEYDFSYADIIDDLFERHTELAIKQGNVTDIMLDITAEDDDGLKISVFVLLRQRKISDGEITERKTETYKSGEWKTWGRGHGRQ